MQVISHARAKQIRALHQKKQRSLEGLFLVEGAKAVLEVLAADWHTEFLVVSEDFARLHPEATSTPGVPCFLAPAAQLHTLSTFQTNQAAIALVRQKQPLPKPVSTAGLWLAVDRLSDPGNLGTIIRLADWFGLEEVMCIGDCVEWYNPKVIAASMGSFLRINPVAVQPASLPEICKNRAVLAADMDGTSLYEMAFPASCVVVIGNESHGIGAEIAALAKARISIPRFGGAESLNAAMATGIILSQWRYNGV